MWHDDSQRMKRIKSFISPNIMSILLKENKLSTYQVSQFSLVLKCMFHGKQKFHLDVVIV